MSGKIISQTDTYKYLGILFDEKLDWKPQIDRMCSKLSSVCGVISKVCHYLDRKSLMLIYNSLVESRLKYGLLGWSTASNDQLDRIKVLQNRAIRFIDFAPISESLLPLYRHYNVLPLSKLIKLQQASYMYSHHNALLPKVFRSYCSKPAHSLTRYSKTNYVRPKEKLKRHEKSMKIIGPKVWSGIPQDLKSLPFRKTFSKHLKLSYISDLPSIRKTHVIERPRLMTDEQYENMIVLFETNDEDLGEFLGFDLEFEALFNSINESDTTFLGFDLDMETLFNTTNESEDEFHGF